MYNITLNQWNLDLNTTVELEEYDTADYSSVQKRPVRHDVKSSTI